MPTIQNAKDSVLVALTTFVSFLPSLIGALIILIVGWIIAKIMARLLERILISAGFERAMERSGITDFIHRAGSTTTGSHIVAELLKWFVMLIFIQAAANLLRVTEVTAILNSIVLFIPRVMIAIAIIVVGALIARVLAGIVRGFVSEMGVLNPGLFATLTQYTILGFSIIAALDHLQIAKTVVDTLLIGLVASVSLAVGLAFGLGGRDVGAKITESWYAKTRNIPRRVGEGQPRVISDQIERTA